MKKLFLTLTAVTALTVASHAQTEQGKFLIGGQVGFQTSKQKDADSKFNSFSINPTAGYFVSDNWAVGTGIGYSWSNRDNGMDQEFKTNWFNVSPFVRNYIGEGQFKFFSQLSVPMAWGKQTVETLAGTTETKLEHYGVELAPGFAFFPASNVGIELKVRGLYFESQKDKTNDLTNNTFGLDVNSLAPTLGVQFYF
ncbi:outer membrane beta-barrel protein [Sphingobacterium deserti]|uniref:Outer membrane protein beta-barrel domain-containing protein n=1 Tax=Sphingobacterium deserti TaxID=1229276 RepID=A0A0B8T6J9_9SPHI|nr:outer membrane beta-barrel protein [Sphingobacterium deserti]KGE12910.1 hypothetical protein DI53_3347 [Sphingobacterium deserti]